MKIAFRHKYPATFSFIATVVVLFSSLSLHSLSPEGYPSDPEVVLSEIMYNPIGSEYYDEFVEIYNLSSQDSVDLSGWEIGDGEGFDRIISVNGALKLAPSQYGLILDSGYFSHSTTYDSLIPPEALLLTIEGSSFGRRGWSNSSAKTVMLLDSSGTVVDQYTYTLGNQPGHSDEKIDLAGGNSPENWGESIPLNGTPGFRNSLSPQEYDLSLSLLDVPVFPPEPNNVWQISLQVKNTGISPAFEFIVKGYRYIHSQTPDSTLIYQTMISDTLEPTREIELSVSLRVTSPGRKNFRFYLYFKEDLNQMNNRVDYSVTLPFSSGDLVINEIMYYPRRDSSEWIEVYNSASYPVDLQSWKLMTESEYPDSVVLSEWSFPLDTNSYWIFTGDSLRVASRKGHWIFVPDFPRLKDTGEGLHLLDPSGKLIDVVRYDPGWGKRRGFSLERIWFERSGQDSTNWHLSLGLEGTPGVFNSTSPLKVDVALDSLILQPNPAPYSAALHLEVLIENVGRRSIDNQTLALFHDRNGDFSPAPEELLLPVQPIPVPLASEDTLLLHYRFSSLESGIWPLSALLQLPRDQNPGNNYRNIEVRIGYKPASLVLNEIMYHPLPGDPEWIEVLNQSDLMLNLRDWQLWETTAEKGYLLSDHDFFLPPNSFGVIAADSSVSTSAPLLVPHRFPNLNDTEEQIALVDFSGTVIDSLHYFHTWGGDVGVSLERIQPGHASQDSSNWASSAAPAGMTPGEQNSIYLTVLPSQTTLSISPNPFSPDGDGHDDYTMIQYHLPMTTAYVSLKIYDMMGRLVCDLLNTAPSGSHREVIWNGKRNNGEDLRIGVYIVFLQALNANMGLIKQVKKPIVLAGRL